MIGTGLRPDRRRAAVRHRRIRRGAAADFAATFEALPITGTLDLTTGSAHPRHASCRRWWSPRCRSRLPIVARAVPRRRRARPAHPGRAALNAFALGFPLKIGLTLLRSGAHRPAAAAGDRRTDRAAVQAMSAMPAAGDMAERAAPRRPRSRHRKRLKEGAQARARSPARPRPRGLGDDASSCRYVIPGTVIRRARRRHRPAPGPRRRHEDAGHDAGAREHSVARQGRWDGNPLAAARRHGGLDRRRPWSRAAASVPQPVEAEVLADRTRSAASSGCSARRARGSGVKMLHQDSPSSASPHGRADRHDAPPRRRPGHAAGLDRGHRRVGRPRRCSRIAGAALVVGAADYVVSRGASASR